MITKAFEKWWSESKIPHMVKLVNFIFHRHNKFANKLVTDFARDCFVAGWIASSYHPIVKETKDDNS
jgi:hypothetical protein